MKKNNHQILTVAKRRPRKADGLMLVEMLIAILVLSIAMASLMQGLSQMGTTSTSTQNQVMASNIVQELIDQARNARFDDTGGQLGLTNANVSDGAWHPVGVYQTISGQPAYLPRPLVYTGTTVAGLNNKFNGSVRQMLTNLAPGSPNGQVQLTVEVSWDGENTGANNKRTHTATAYISQWGIHN